MALVEFQVCKELSPSLLCVQSQGKRGIFSIRQKKMVLFPVCNDEPFLEVRVRYAKKRFWEVRKGQHVGLFSEPEEALVLPMEYDAILHLGREYSLKGDEEIFERKFDSLFWVKKGGKQGVYSVAINAFIVPAEYDQVRQLSEEIFSGKREGEWTSVMRPRLAKM